MKTAVELDKVAGDVKTLRTDANRLVKATGIDAKEGLRETRERLGKAIASARQTCEKRRRNSAKAFRRRTNAFGGIRMKPLVLPLAPGS
jgi:ElaB/YqjD/DUF883 family membrane-anchored ribosome-binding protein